MKGMLSLIIFILMAGMALAAPVKITGAGEAYGHHGSCGSWNGCGNAETCAQWACEINGFGTAVSYVATNCFALSDKDCQLFSEKDSVDCGWDMNCDVPVVTDIWCDDGSYSGYCFAELPPQENAPEGDGDIPEFTAIGAGLAMLGAAGFIAIRKKLY